MAPAATPGGPAAAAVDEVARALAEDIRVRVDAIAEECSAFLTTQIAEVEADPALRAALADAVHDNLERIFRSLRDGIPATAAALAPPGAIAHAVAVARRREPMHVLLRAYQSGVGWLWTLWQAEHERQRVDPRLVAPLLERSMGFTFAYADSVVREISGHYLEAQARMLRGTQDDRAAAARALLAGDVGDPPALARRLRYELDRWHVGFVLGPEPDATCAAGDLRAAARRLAGALGDEQPLAIAPTADELWAWVAVDGPHPPALARLGEVALPAGVHAGSGEPACGAEGFRGTHREALRARQVGRMGARRGAAVTHFARVRLAALLASDLDRARAFTLRELGALAADDDATARLRATVLISFEEGGSTAATARRLHLHYGTVQHRLRRASERLGRDVSERRFELEAALRLYPLVAFERPHKPAAAV